jgi:hypothetical protein
MDNWIRHSGNGRPVAIGTLVEVEMFNGVRRTITTGKGTYDLDGTPIPLSRSAGWSAWNYFDGGPMGPKFKAYRIASMDGHHQRRSEMFRSWLNVGKPIQVEKVG